MRVPAVVTRTVVLNTGSAEFKKIKYLLKSNIQVKGQRLSGIANWRDGVLQTGRRCTGDQLHCVHARVVTHLRGQEEIDVKK